MWEFFRPNLTSEIESGKTYLVYGFSPEKFANISHINEFIDPEKIAKNSIKYMTTQRSSNWAREWVELAIWLSFEFCQQNTALLAADFYKTSNFHTKVENFEVKYHKICWTRCNSSLMCVAHREVGLIFNVW